MLCTLSHTHLYITRTYIYTYTHAHTHTHTHTHDNIHIMKLQEDPICKASIYAWIIIDGIDKTNRMKPHHKLLWKFHGMQYDMIVYSSPQAVPNTTYKQLILLISWSLYRENFLIVHQEYPITHLKFCSLETNQLARRPF